MSRIGLIGCVVTAVLLVPVMALGDVIYIDDHFEGAIEPGWTLYGGARLATAFLFNDPYSPPSGEKWGVGQDAWGGTVDGGLFKTFYDEEMPGETKYFTALVEAFSTIGTGLQPPATSASGSARVQVFSPTRTTPRSSGRTCTGGSGRL
ncbi:MAG: hypothetical protein QUV05_02250 [Phycisphaerae bacterium]|nr:hypothetical protein [Phycisphaerae bacterium]